MAGVNLGVGRNKTTDPVCPDAGVEILKHKGDSVKKGDLIMRVYGKDSSSVSASMPLLKNAIAYSDKAPQKDKLIFKIIKQEEL